MRRRAFVITFLAFVAATTWALISDAAVAWVAAVILLFTGAAFLLPWLPGAGDNHDSIGEGGSGV